jgi:predicted nucleotidyltransferase
MQREEVLTILRRHAPALRARGVRHAALFGSVARGEARPDSDIDILIEFDPRARVTIYDYVRLKSDIAGLFQETVDVIDRDALKPYLFEPAVRDAVYAF